MENFGRYQLQEKLGQGGMGIVYRAFDTVLERTVALKVVLPNVLDDELRTRLFREARAAGNLKHKNIVTIYDLGEHEGRPYLAMEYMEGEDLQRRLARPEKMSLLYKIDLAMEMCDGLGYAHAHGVIHRDVKPANIFIMDSGGAKVVDFGLARLMTSQLTRSNMLMGTLNYMAPEQVRGERADQRSDIFSTGVVLYELLGGRKAFDGDTVASTLYKILQDVPEPLWKLDAALPRDLAEVVERMLAKLPDERYQTMDQVRRDLEGCRERYRTGDRSTPVPLQMSPHLLETVAAGAFAAPTFEALRDSGAPAPLPTPAAAPVPGGPATPVPAATPISAHGSGARNNRAPIVTAAVLVALAAGGLWWFAGRSREPAAGSAAAPSPVVAAPTPAAPPAPSQTRVAEPAGSGRENAPSESRRSSQVDRAPATSSNTKRVTVRDRATEGGSRRVASAAPTAPVASAPPSEPPGKTQVSAPPPLPTAPVSTTPPDSVGSPVASRPPVPAPPESSASGRAASSPLSGSAPAANPAPAAAAQERIAALLDQYRQALEGKSMDQLKRIWPSLGGSAEAAIRQEFSHAASITVGIEEPQITVSGASAQVRFVRNYSLVTVDGQHLQSTTHAVIDARKIGPNWVIGAIRFSER